MGCHFLLQGIFPTQGSNPGLPHCRQTLLTSEPPGKPKCSELRFRKKKASVCARWWGESFLCIVVELNESIYVKHSSLCLAYSSSCYSVTKSCPTLCDTIDCSPSGSFVHGISQASVLCYAVSPCSLSILNMYILHMCVHVSPRLPN